MTGEMKPPRFLIYILFDRSDNRGGILLLSITATPIPVAQRYRLLDKELPLFSVIFSVIIAFPFVLVLPAHVLTQSLSQNRLPKLFQLLRNCGVFFIGYINLRDSLHTFKA